MIIAYINLEKRVPQGHPLRKIKPLADQELKRLSPLFTEMYSHTGRPSIPPGAGSEVAFADRPVFGSE